MKPDQKEPFFRRSRRIQEVLLLFLMVTVVFLVYANTLHNPFVFDDFVAITKNKNIRLTSFSLWELIGSPRHSAYSTRPVAMMSFALNYSLHRYEPFGYHLINIGIHLFTGLFLYFFIKTTFRAVSLQTAQSADKKPYGICFIAYATAFLWLVNPVQTQSVNYVMQRMNSMAAMFFVLSMLFYAHARLAENRNRKRQLFAACLFAAILAVGSKENAAVLPGFIFLYEWFFFRDLSFSWFRRRAMVFGLLLLLIGLLGFLFLEGQPIEKITAKYATKNFTIGQRLLTEARVVVYYFTLILYPNPSRLNLDYNFPLSFSIVDPVSTLLSILVIGGMIWLAMRIARKNRMISFCIFWYFGNLLIESTIIPVDIIYEHRMYLPSMLVMPALFILFYPRLRQKRAVIILFSAVVAVWSFWTMERNKVWRDEAVLWADAAEKSPDKARPHINLADVLIARGEISEAVRHAAIAVRIDPDSAAAHINMGSALFKSGKIDASIRHFEKVLQISPYDHQAHNNLGLAFVCQGKLEAATAHFQKAVWIKPGFSKARLHLDKALELRNAIYGPTHDFAKALQKLDIREATLSEKVDNLHSTKLRLEKGLRKYQTAISRLRKNRRLDPNQIEGVGRVKKQYENQLNLFQQIVQDRNILSAHYDIACILSRKNKIDEALHALRSALKGGFNNRDLIKIDTDLQNIKNKDALQRKWPDDLLK